MRQTSGRCLCARRALSKALVSHLRSLTVRVMSLSERASDLTFAPDCTRSLPLIAIALERKGSLGRYAPARLS